MILNYEKELINPDTNERILLKDGMVLQFDMGNSKDITGVVVRVFRIDDDEKYYDKIAFELIIASIDGKSGKGIAGQDVKGTVEDFNKEITKLKVFSKKASQWIYRVAGTKDFLDGSVFEENDKCL